MARRIPFFTLFYSTTFSLLLIVLLVLLLITPGDHVYQAYQKSHLYNIFIIAGAYLLTLLIAAFIFASRLYTTRTTLASVPRDWFYDEKSRAVPRKVRKLVKEGLERSACIAWAGRPRDLRGEEQEDGRERRVPHWGIISHPGWSSPESSDLPNLYLPPIILELPHLIEAKAVSIAPTITDPTLEDETPIASPLAVSLLQRPAAASLRDYLTHLSSLGLINPPQLLPTFLQAYESARFSGEEISEATFALDHELVSEIRATEEAELEALEPIDGASGSEDAEKEPRSSLETASTVEHIPIPVSSSSSSSEHSQRSLRTAPSAQYSQRDRDRTDSGSSDKSVVRQHRGLRTPSIATLRSIRSRASSVLTGSSVGGGSVIHLADAAGPLELPYRIDSEGS